ncbi:MAG TPA: gamma-glutamylcyclotransferase [Verrucomicrobiales bacterium]|nr:gamma-glutamylcyclotransferase [Verrucomicrobiales bacterium]
MELAPTQERCPRSRVWRLATLEGWRFLINETGYATVVPMEGRTTYGLLWQLNLLDEPALDQYEGIGEGLYTKEWLNVGDSAGQTVRALCYRAVSSVPGSPQPGYLEGIIAAAVALGLPATYIDELRSWLPLGKAR